MKTTHKILKNGLLATICFSVMMLFMPVKAHGDTDIVERPFGGMVVTSIPCTCTNMYLNYVMDYTTNTVVPLVAIPGLSHFYPMCHIGLTPYPPINAAEFFCPAAYIATSFVPTSLPLYHLGQYIVEPNEYCGVVSGNSCIYLPAVGIYDGGRGYEAPGTGTSFYGSRFVAQTPLPRQVSKQNCSKSLLQPASIGRS